MCGIYIRCTGKHHFCGGKGITTPIIFRENSVTIPSCIQYSGKSANINQEKVNKIDKTQLATIGINVAKSKIACIM